MHLVRGVLHFLSWVAVVACNQGREATRRSSKSGLGRCRIERERRLRPDDVPWLEPRLLVAAPPPVQATAATQKTRERLRRAPQEERTRPTTTMCWPREIGAAQAWARTPPSTPATAGQGS